VIGGFPRIQHAELLVYGRGGGAGLHLLGAAGSRVRDAAGRGRAGAAQCR